MKTVTIKKLENGKYESESGLIWTEEQIQAAERQLTVFVMVDRFLSDYPEWS